MGKRPDATYPKNPPLKDFNDEFASQIDWTPLEEDSEKFKTHHLYQINNNLLAYKKSLWMKSYGILSIAVAIGLLIFIKDIQGLHKLIFLVIIIGLLIWGIFAAFVNLEPIEFDKNKGVFLTGRNQKRQLEVNPSSKAVIKLKDIYAIQLLAELVELDRFSDNESYYSYELNLVLKSGERINVIDHGDGFQILADAKKLSQFLNVPVWNGILNS